jgi:hypothetical protein
MLGTYVNAIVVAVGCTIGLLIKNGLADRYKETIMHGVALSVLFIGISTTLTGMFDGGEPILFIISLVLGAIIGELINIDQKLNNLGLWLQSKVGKGEHNIAQGFVTASLLFCVGTMSILGSLESGLRGNHDMLYAKSVLDGVEMDVMTGLIAQKLYPNANIEINGLQRASVIPGTYDLVISNVPFGDIRVFDKSWSSSKQPIYTAAQKRVHNYFIVKGLEMLRPGGVMAIITSSGTMDSKGNAIIRNHIGQKSEFLLILKYMFKNY